MEAGLSALALNVTGVSYDRLTEEGAKREARELKLLWQGRGFKKALFWPKKITYKPYDYLPLQETIWVVRSNLVNGVPPK